MNQDFNISERGIIASQTELRADFKLFFEASNDLWEKDKNPGGKFPLNMAENNLTWPLLKNEMESKLKSLSIPDWVSNYTAPKGAPVFIDSLAEFMSRHLCQSKVSPEFLLTSAGSTAIIELLAWVLCDKGNVAVIPSPAYPVYTQDINNKAGLIRYDLQTHHDLTDLEGKDVLVIEDLERAKLAIENKGNSFKLLILTSPDNPSGRLYSIGELDNISNWCIKNKIHLVVNELYGLSLIDTSHEVIREDYKVEKQFNSFAKLIALKQSDYLHQVYALSKDLGASGFRVGVFYSMNKKALEAMANLNIPHMVSNLTQWAFSELLLDETFFEQYIKINQKNITASYVTVIKSLKRLNIPYIPARGSLFSWLDVSAYLKDNTAEEEHKLWLSLYEKEGLLLTPGTGFGHSKFGQFRLVHTYLETEALAEAMMRFERFFTKIQNSEQAL